jgi:hypothetical protein
LGTTRLTLGEDSMLLTLRTEEKEPDTRFWLRPGGLFCPEVDGDVKTALAPSEASIGDFDLQPCTSAPRHEKKKSAFSPKQSESDTLSESDKNTTAVESDRCDTIVESDVHEYYCALENNLSFRTTAIMSGIKDPKHKIPWALTHTLSCTCDPKH